MANTYNKTIIIGRLARDPELNQGKKTEYVNFNLSNSTFRDGKEEVQWHRICAFGKQATLCHDHLHKGDLCCVEGRIDNRSYEKDGQKRYFQSIIAEKITFLSSRRSPNANNVTEDQQLDEAFPY
ncbi:MAG: single-stranded DNA-binding protein [Proteobacteria bacterium]|nr:single-stranded DNA-binding protein [Pseudomonadota bacterium]